MSKKKELLVLGATVASCVAAAAGYSFFIKENQPDQPDQPPKKELIETAKDTILEKEMQNASSAFDDENEIKIIEAKASEGTWHKLK